MSLIWGLRDKVNWPNWLENFIFGPSFGNSTGNNSNPDVVQNTGSPISVDDERFAWQRNALQDASLQEIVLNSQITPAATYHYKVDVIQDISSLYEALITDNDTSRVRMKLFKTYLNIWSDVPFNATFFVGISEGGDGYTAQEGVAGTGDTVIALAAAQAGYASEAQVIPVGHVNGRFSPLSGHRYHTNVKIDLSAIVEKYLQMCEQNTLLHHLTNPEMRLLMFVHEVTAAQAVYYGGFTKFFSYTVH